MNNIIQNLSEITDSREMLEAKPHKFTSIFAYGLIAILIIALIWTYFGEIDIVVKTNGVVKSNDKTISVLNEVDGKVVEVSFKEGQRVKKGDILYSLFLHTCKNKHPRGAFEGGTTEIAKGQKGELKIGMTCEAQVITKRKKILYFLLEKINLKN